MGVSSSPIIRKIFSGSASSSCSIRLQGTPDKRRSRRTLASSAARHPAPCTERLSHGHQTRVLSSVASPTRQAAHDRPCTRVPKRSFPDVVPRRRAEHANLRAALFYLLDERSTYITAFYFILDSTY